MKALAITLLAASRVLAQDAKEEEKANPQAALEVTDSQAGLLGGFAADKVDENTAAEELEKAIHDEVALLKKPADPATTEPPKAKGKKRARKKAPKKNLGASSEPIKNGLTEGDRQAFGKFIVTELNAGHQGQVLADAMKKELERLRAERIKASSSADATPKKKKKRKGQDS